MMNIQDRLEYSPEVREALAAGKPVVALESTIISHGMPYPENVNTAKEVEEIVRSRGAVPATLAILGGKVKVGLTEAELEHLAHSEEVLKVSRRDLPYVISAGKDGATTVAATMILAEWAGIDVFVTGGIGGVHREGQNTLDISADLNELSRTDVAVVCAGAKSILDIGLTLEYLETHGVPVVGVGTEEFPAFYSRRSGYPLDVSLETPEEIARLIHVKWSLGLKGGVVVANPIPEEDALDADEMDDIIRRALAKAEEQGISGKEVTPFLLDEVKRMTGGASLKANIALVKHNARVGAELAVQLADMGRS
ncbi:pseudouridine-5'-phosphate glycosidase [Kroppenstedtia eburnea]|uniref:Pseudouridine-5'-phosphate glycosidase n=1 Tax=Kroppenstedtia eburnea TaxID=714067 RepID=A0A1N7KXF6_9BACL|nr:pseudouridine-5'-phosphate glycosidase [Kroppenstedtia eburnea]SIS66275.1 pseudouridine-5'-phosphate glycosidase [Kroppenstedtia eburnea]